MPRPGTLLLIAVGVALVGYEYLNPATDMSRDLAEITRISVAPDRSYRDEPVIPTFAPTSVSFRAVADDGGEKTEAPSLSPQKPGAWTTVVSSGATMVSPVRSSRPADPATRFQLARDLQQELQRVGCYQGELTGTWNAATRRAMATFMDRANAVLPFDKPDYVLLALVQSHKEIACAAPCPSGQSVDEGGRCVPNAVIAQAAKRSKRLDERRQAQARLADVRRAEDAMRLGASRSEPEVLPWLKTNPASAQPSAVAMAPRTDPLPGRMSIGGPPVPAAVPSAQSWASAPIVAAPAISDGASTGDGNGAGGLDQSPPKVAALQYEPDANDLSDDATPPPSDVPATAIGPDAESHKAKKSRRSDREARPRRATYSYSGKRRRGDPRPGTARFNLMQSLGGVY